MPLRVKLWLLCGAAILVVACLFVGLVAAAEWILRALAQ